jgi:hypothetical protein
MDMFECNVLQTIAIPPIYRRVMDVFRAHYGAADRDLVKNTALLAG